MVRVPLNVDATHDYAEQLYGERRRPSGRRVLAHAEALATMAHRVTLCYYQALRNFAAQDPQELAELAQHAGLLHGAYDNLGATYEDVCEITNSQVAELVGTCSLDPRLPQPRRLLEYQSRMAEANLLSQIFGLCQTLAAIEELRWWVDKTRTAKDNDRLAEAFPVMVAGLDAAHRLRRYAIFNELLKHGANMLQESQRLVSRVTPKRRPKPQIPDVD